MATGSAMTHARGSPCRRDESLPEHSPPASDGRDADDTDSVSDEGAVVDMFAEPADFRPKTPPPTVASYTLSTPVLPSDVKIELSLVGSHPLWGHHLWNAAPTLSDYLAHAATAAAAATAGEADTDELSRSRDVTPLTCAGKAVLELGAAAGLPSIVAHHLGADIVVCTDYPDPDLIHNLESNIQQNTQGKGTCAAGYIWGADTTGIKSHLRAEPGRFFDLVLMSDLIFNHQAHGAMLDTLDKCLPPPSCGATNRRDSCQSNGAASAQGDVRNASKACFSNGPHALVFFTHHRPHLAHRDMEFFSMAQGQGWSAEQIGQWKMNPMFPNDPGSEEVRATVHGWRVWR